MDNFDPTKKTLWHQILSHILKQLLTPLGITVLSDVKVMTNPPEADILLLKRKDSKHWTEKQLEQLPDGVRDSTASHILIEFKATESISKETFIQAAAYNYFYQQSQNLTDNELQTFVISAIQPQKANREQYGYKIRVQPGVYQSDQIAFNHMTLISLNELPDELHNAWITCLASKQLKRLKAFKILQSQGFKFIQMPFKLFLAELWQHISIKGDDDMALNLSPQERKNFFQMWGSSLFTPEEFKDLLSTVPLEERLKGLKPEERLKGLKPEERFIGLKPEERFIGLKPEERFIGLKPEEQLAGLSDEEIEAYLEQRRKQKKMGLKPEERLAGLPFSEIEVLEERLKKLKQQKKGNC